MSKETTAHSLDQSIGTFRDEGVVHFDWQMACIAHPFSDVFELYFDYDGFAEPGPSEWHDMDVEREQALFDASRRYLAHFGGEFGVCEDELKEEFALGRCYGHCVMFWSTMMSLPATEYQYRPRLAEYLRDTAACTEEPTQHRCVTDELCVNRRVSGSRHVSKSAATRNGECPKRDLPNPN